jgi:surfeit locus 1 family protein
MDFKPKLWSSIGLVLGLLLFIRLGIWQTNRNGSQNERHQRIANVSEQPPLREVTDENADHWRKVHLNGVFQEELYLVEGRTRWYTAGYDVLQVFRNSSDGQSILINRGWIPLLGSADRIKDIKANALPNEVYGIILPIPGQIESRPLPATKIEPIRWEHNNYLGIITVVEELELPFVIYSGKDFKPAGAQMPEYGLIEHEKPKLKTITHYAYAMTWFLIAFLLLVHWLSVTVKIKSPEVLEDADLAS